jgi:DNA-binding TFAR19-related protein (PDSD5 family)
MIFHIINFINMKNNTEIVIAQFNSTVDVNKKYNESQLINLLSKIYENNIKKIKLIHEKPLLLKENYIKKK